MFYDSLSLAWAFSVFVCSTDIPVVVGEEQPGGLVIIRAPPARSSSQDVHPIHIVPQQPSIRASSVPVHPQTHLNGNSLRPPAKKLKADGVGNLQRARSTTPSLRTDHDTEEETRQSEDRQTTQSEIDVLKPRSRLPDSTNSSINPAFQFPPPEAGGVSRPQKPPSQQRGRIREMTQPLPLQETPEIRKNKIMRGEVLPGHTRRKSSLSRGKRISSTFESTGVIGEYTSRIRSLCCFPRQVSLIISSI